MNESDLIEAIQNILNGSNSTVQKQSDHAFKNFRDHNPNEFFLSSLTILRNQSNPINVRSFCAVAVRKNLSSFSESNFTNMWPLLSAEVKLFVKETLFVCLDNENVKPIRNLISDTLGEVGSSLLLINEWPDFIQTIWQLFALQKNELIEDGLKILSTVFTYVVEHFYPYIDVLQEIFSKCLPLTNKHIILATIRAFGNYITFAEPEYCRKFESLVHQLVDSIYNLLVIDETMGEDGLMVLIEIAEAEPKFFRGDFDNFFETMIKINLEHRITSGGIKKMSVEILISVAERFATPFRDKPDRVYQLFELLFLHMISIPDKADLSWEKPPEGFDREADDENFDVIRFGSSSIDRIIASIGEKITLPLLIKVVQIMLQQTDWRYKNAALFALAQVGDYIDDIEEIRPLVEAVVSYLSNENPRIRYAACHVLGQLATDLRPDFQSKYFDVIVPALMINLNDSVPRVISQASSALANTIEGMKMPDLLGFLPQIIGECTRLLRSGISIVKEDAVSCITAAAQSSFNQIQPYCEGITINLFEILQINHKNYRQLRANCIECLSFLAHAVGKEHFSSYTSILIPIMIRIQEGQLEENDPQKTQLLTAWQRLCLALGSDFIPWLPRIIPSLFKVVTGIFSSYNIKDKKDRNINTHEYEEAQSAIKMLKVLVAETKENFLEYADETSRLILPLCSFPNSSTIRKEASKCLPSILSCMKRKPHSVLISKAKIFLEALWKAAEEEYEAETIVGHVSGMKECLEQITIRFLDTEEVNLVSKKIIKLLFDSERRKCDYENNKNKFEIDFDEKSLYDEDIIKEEELELAIADLITSLIKSHKELTLPLIEVLSKELLPNIFDGNTNFRTKKMLKFGLFLIDDVLEHMDLNLLLDKLRFYSQTLLRFSNNETAMIRQAACYGIGLLAAKSGTFFSDIIFESIDQLSKALRKSQNNEKARVFGSSHDNVVASVGKILKYHSDKLGSQLSNVLQLWLDHLPLKYDIDEALEQHEMLLSIVTTNPSIIIGENGSNVPKIVKIYGSIIGTRVCNPSIKEKIIESIKYLKSLPSIKDSWEEGVRDLPQVQKNKLNNLV